MGNHHDDLARLASFFGGEEAINVVKALAQAGTTTDDVIATQANLRLHTARKVLYKLYDHALVTCQGSRDVDARSVIQHWKRQQDELVALVRRRHNGALQALRARLRFGNDPSFFMCEVCLDL